MVTVTKELARFKIEVSQMKDLESSNGMSVVTHCMVLLTLDRMQSKIEK